MVTSIRIRSRDLVQLLKVRVMWKVQTLGLETIRQQPKSTEIQTTSKLLLDVCGPAKHTLEILRAGFCGEEPQARSFCRGFSIFSHPGQGMIP